MSHPFQISPQRLLGAVAMWCVSFGLCGVVLRTDLHELMVAPWPGIEAWIACGTLFCGGVGLLFRKPMVGTIVGFAFAVLSFYILAAVHLGNGSLFVIPAVE